MPVCVICAFLPFQRGITILYSHRNLVVAGLHLNFIHLKNYIKHVQKTQVQPNFVLPPQFKTLCFLIAALCSAPFASRSQDYIPLLSIMTPNVNSAGSSSNLDLISRVITWGATQDFLGLNDKNVHVKHYSPFEECLKVTQNSPPQIGPGWYDCSFTKDTDGTDLIIATWNYNQNHHNGVTTYDAVLIRQVALGPDPKLFANPYASIAADVDEDGEITEADAGIVMNLVIGYIPTFPIESWRFVPTGHLLLNLNFQSQFSSNPLEGIFPPYPTYLGSYSRLLTQPGEYDPLHLSIIGGSVGVRTGDVNFSNGDAFPFTAPPTDRGSNVLAVAEQPLKKGTVISVTLLSVGEMNSLVALQTAVQCNDAKLRVLGIEQAGIPGLGEKNYLVNDQGNGFRLAWLHPQTKGSDFPPQTGIFSVVMELLQDVEADEPLLTWGSGMHSVFYHLDGSPIPVTLVGKTEIIFEPRSFTASPNPFNDVLRIQASTGSSVSPSVCTLTDVSGREVGNAVIPLDEKGGIMQTAHLSPGLYYLKVTHSSNTEVFPVIKH